jgi:DNA-binding transcriptional LysR family regulator
MEQPAGPLQLDRVSWDDLRVFVAVARTLSFRKAARVLRASSSTVVRRMDRLEKSFGLRLFDRVPEGVALTAEGRAILESAQHMERATHDMRARLDRDPMARGIVRCSVTEGLGTIWILPHLAQFGRTHPATVVDLRCTMDIADVLRMESDVAIQLKKPDRPDAIAVRLGRMHVYPFASPRYVELYGTPRSLADLKHHRLIHQIAPQIGEDDLRRGLGLPTIDGITAMRVNTSTALASAIELGIGIGPLPTYLVGLGTDLIPLDLGVRHEVDIWMTYHPDARSVRRVAVFVDWLKTLFDPKRYPWFGDEFIHPRELASSPTCRYQPADLPLRRPLGIAKLGGPNL